MSYHNSSSSSSYNAPTTSQRQAAPPGYHYMPDGSLMLDSEMPNTAQKAVAPPGYHYMPDGSLMLDSQMAIRDSDKLISKFDFDLSDIPPNGGRRSFIVNGENGSEFILEIRDEAGLYYNFVTSAFQAEKANLQQVVGVGSTYRDYVTFPSLAGGNANNHYDILLYATPGTKHETYNEVRFLDNSIDINSSTGSNSLMLNKIVYQYAAITLTIGTLSPTGTVSSATTNAVITANRGRSLNKTDFSVICNAGGSAAYRVLKQPVGDDVLSFLEPTIGATPIVLPGENIYPAVTGTDTVDGAVSSGVKVVMDNNVATKMEVGDRITGNVALSATTVTVVALNPDGDNPKEFSMSEAIGLANNLALSFSNQMNFSWPIGNFANLITSDMIVLPVTGLTEDSAVSSYSDSITLFAGQKEEKIIVKNKVEALSTLAKKPTIIKGLTTVQEGGIIFNKQQKLVLADTTLKIGGYGTTNTLKLYGWEIIFTNLAITLTPPTTTTTEATSNHAVIAVADREGVINNFSTVSGIGIDPSVKNPTITAGGGSDGAGDWTMSANQTLENTAILTVGNTGRIATITGTIEVIKAGSASQVIRFDVDKLVSNSAPS